MTWILTHTGKRPNLIDPQPAEICLEDIAHHLSRIGRFTGAGDLFLSVAQHSVHVSLICPAEFARWGLLHDASEAYLGDVSSPLKVALREFGRVSEYDYLQSKWEVAISKMFGVPRVSVKQWDVQSALTERRDNGPYGADELDWFGASRYPGLVAHPDPYVPWTPARAKAMFLQRAEEVRIK